MSILVGNPALVEQPATRGFSVTSGYFTQHTFKGTLDACNAGANELVGANSWDISGGDNGVYTLTARFAGAGLIENPGVEVPVREERLQHNQVQKSIFNHPGYALTNEQISILRKVLDENRKFSDVEISQVDEDGLLLFALAKRGVESFTVYQPVVSVIDTASRNYPWTAEFTNVGKIFSTPGMIDDAELTSGWKSGLPTNVSATTGFDYGWLKIAPEVVTSGIDRSQLVQQYEYGLWAVDLYDFV